MDMSFTLLATLLRGDTPSPQVLSALLGLRELTGSPVTAAELETLRALQEQKESGH